MTQKKMYARRANNLIMLVEDDNLVAKLLSHTLSQRGFDVKIAADGHQAIENLGNSQLPKLILLDIILPCADGFEVLSQIRANKRWKKIPIIMLTSKTQEFNVVRAFESGANDYVTKPFQLGELMVRINRLLN